MTDKERQPLNADPKRQAHNQLGGYRYQILHSVDAWLDLTKEEALYLECAEDFDRESGDTVTATQIKHTQHNITLRSQEVTDAINNYWKLRVDNPNKRVKFRLLTRSKIGIERDNPFGTGKPGLQVWSRCSGDEATITKISEFLQSEGKISDEVKDFLSKAEPKEIYELLIEPITWETGSEDTLSVEQSINEKLVVHGNQLGLLPSEAEKVVAPLINEAWRVATQKENRELTKRRFCKIFEEETTLRVPIQRWRRLEMLETQTNILDTASAKFLGSSTGISIQSYSPVQNTIPPPLPDAYPRTELLSSIQAKLQSEGIVVIHGGTDRGKTTIATLIARDASDPWLWRGFKKREPSQVLQHLHQLAIEIGDESSPFNIILDDLNLQPQELQEYEEVLSVVIHGAIERGAKMLITSQHEPHDNLTRHLGLSPSIVVKILDFTLSEIEQFAEQLACPPSEVKPLASLIQAHTGGHPRLVHARLARLREENWKRPDSFESIVQTPQEVLKGREGARQLLIDLPENHREFLYRLSLMPMGFRKDYALNIGDIPESIPFAGDIFSQLVGPWIDQVTETYYIISPLLTRAAEHVWSEGRIKDLHAQIANAILKTRNLTPIEVWTVLTHSMAGQNKDGFITVIQVLRTVPEDNWKEFSQEFSLLIHLEPHIPEKQFPGDVFVNHLFRSLQHRIAVEVEPEAAPNILEKWDKETVPYEPHQLYLRNRLFLATQALRYYQIPLPAKRIVGYLREIIDITESNNEAREIYYSSYIAHFEEQKAENSNYFSALLSFCYRAPNPKLSPLFLSDLIDALDELPPKIRTLLLADFEDDSVDCRLLIDGVWLAESKLEKPDWTGCLQVFDKVIEKTLAWDYPYLAAASARGKAIIHGLYLHDPDTAHKVLQNIVTQVGALPAKEDGQILNIYERILTEWHASSEQLDVMPPEVYHQGAICAAHLDDWESAATFFEAGAKRSQKIGNTERHIGLYADAGFAHFNAGNMLQSIKLLNLALQKFEKLPQDNADVKYFTLKQCLASTIGWMAGYESGNYLSELIKPQMGFCSALETNEKILTLPDSPIEEAWLDLAQIEYRFGNGTTVLEHVLRITDRDTYPELSLSLSLLEAQHDFRNKTLENLPQRIYQLASAYASIQKHNQTGRGVEEKGIYSISIVDLSNFASVEHIVVILVAALLVQLRTSTDVQDILVVWRTNSSELPIKVNMICALDIIESVLSGNHSNALTVMEAQDAKCEKPLVAALKVIQNIKTSPENLFHAHTLITTSLIGSLWEDPVVTDLAGFLSAQWLEKIKSPAVLQTPRITVPQIEEACKNSETGKKKIGQLLLAVRQAISLEVPSEIMQRFRSWVESESKQKPDPKTGKNPTAQRLLQTMGKPPHLTHEDVEALRQSIEEGKIPVKFDSPFELDGHNEQ